MKRKTLILLSSVFCAASFCGAQESAPQAQPAQLLPQQIEMAPAALAAPAQPVVLEEKDAQNAQNAKSAQGGKGNSAQNLNAREKYDKGDFWGASQDYEKQIASSDGLNPYLFYNLANSYYKDGYTDKAIVNYYKAFRLLPRDKDIKRNLKFALASTGQNFMPEGMPRAAFDLFHFFSLKELQGFLWIFIWIGALSFTAWLFDKKKEAAKKICLISFCAAVLLGFWYFALFQSEGSRMAVVTAPRAEVRSGPAQRFPVSLNVPRAYLVTVLDSKGDWAEVRLHTEGAPVGWILKQSIEEIN